MTVWGNLQIGRLTLTEAPEASATSDPTNGWTVSVAGTEASAVLASQQAAKDRAESLLGYAGATVPCVWQDKTALNGWYTVTGPTTSEMTWNDSTLIPWTANLLRVGYDAEVEVESRLVGGNRLHSTSASPEIWHAPPVGADAYFVGATTPGSVTRTGADGAVTVYRALAAGVNPRWGVPSANYWHGAASITVNGTLRVGLTCPDTPGSWLLSNGIVQVQPRTSTGTLLVTSWLAGTGWGTTKAFDIKRGSTSLGAAQHVTLLRNDSCECVIRLTWNNAPGRTTADLSLKRGARHVGIHLQQYATSGSLRVDDNGAGGTVSDQLSAAGYITSTVNDADGDRWVIGSTLACTAAGTFGLAATTPALALPAFIGVVYGGAGAVSGDAAADIGAQYLGQPTETERVIHR